MLPGPPSPAARAAAELRGCADVPELLVHQSVLIVEQALAGFGPADRTAPPASPRRLRRLVRDAERVATDLVAVCPPGHPARAVSWGALRLVSDLADVAAQIAQHRDGRVPPPVEQLVQAVRGVGGGVVALARAQPGAGRRRCAADVVARARSFDELTRPVLLQLGRDAPAGAPTRRLVRIVGALAVSVTAAERLGRAIGTSPW